MKHLTRTVVLAFLAVLAISAVAASSALASPEWYVKKSGTFKKLTGTETVKVTLENKIELLDLNTFGFSCEGAPGTGEIKAGGAGVINTFEVNYARCKGIDKPKLGKECEFEKFKGVGLPWTMELYKEGTEVRQRIVSKAPGVEFTCAEVATDTCEGATSTHMTINETGGLVEAAFDAKSGKTKCTWSNGNNGEWKGVLKIAPTSTEKSKGVEAIKVE